MNGRTIRIGSTAVRAASTLVLIAALAAPATAQEADSTAGGRGIMSKRGEKTHYAADGDPKKPQTEKLAKSVRNLPGVAFVQSARLTARAVADAARVVATRGALEKLQEALA